MAINFFKMEPSFVFSKLCLKIPELINKSISDTKFVYLHAISQIVKFQHCTNFYHENYSMDNMDREQLSIFWPKGLKQ